ncbi:hypothetical protein [Chryseobacterium sp. Mn2064]|uniref:hypothetical protein n=1 Tax=Chryseobacterium sp. Mn2064 TaxID=3395263 RepID=UPI003BDE1AEA
MEIKGEVFCTSIGVYSQQLTKRKAYTIEGMNLQNIRICNDEGKLKWYSKYYFGSEIEPEITDIRIDDQIENPECDAIEVTIEFSNREKYWLTFTTPQYLDKILNEEPYFSSRHFMIIKRLSEESIKSTVRRLDEQNELIKCCKKYK